MNFKNIFCWFFLMTLCWSVSLLLLNGCANKMAPQGGPKDSLNPFVSQCVPRNQSTHFKGNLVVIEFSEWMREKNLRTELLITPNIQNYTHKIIRNRIEIKIEDTLKTDATYNFNFRKGLEDITEGNVAVMDTIHKQPLRIAFSTGAVIDTMAVEGKITYLKTKKPVENAVVSLYSTADTLKVDKHPPYYFTLTDKEGLYRIENIKAGSYMIYAMKDKDNAVIYREPMPIGFLADPIHFTDSSTTLSNVNLKIDSEDHQAPEAKKSKILGEYFQIEFSEGLADFEVEAKNAEQQSALVYDLIDKGKILQFYNVQEVYDSIPVKLTLTDSLGNKNEEDYKITFRELKDKDKKRKEKDKTTQKIAAKIELVIGGNEIEKDLDLQFIFDKPLAKYDLNKITYLIDKDSVNRQPLIPPDSLHLVRWNKTRSAFYVKRNIPFKESIHITLDSLSFFTIEQDTVSLATQKFTKKDVSKFGTIYGEIITKKPHYILQLVAESGKVLKELTNPKTYDFPFLPAGTYLMRVIIDTNQNGRWDASDVLNNVPAEEIIFLELPNEGKLRERWDLNAIGQF
jgi:hypothetical protein